MRIAYLILAIVVTVSLVVTAAYTVLSYQQYVSDTKIQMCEAQAGAGSAGSSTTYDALLNQCLANH